MPEDTDRVISLGGYYFTMRIVVICAAKVRGELSFTRFSEWFLLGFNAPYICLLTRQGSLELSDAERLQYMEALGDKWANQPRGYAIGLALISRVFKYEADQHSELGPWCTGPYVFEIMDILPFKIVSINHCFSYGQSVCVC